MWWPTPALPWTLCPLVALWARPSLQSCGFCVFWGGAPQGYGSGLESVKGEFFKFFSKRTAATFNPKVYVDFLGGMCFCSKLCAVIWLELNWCFLKSPVCVLNWAQIRRKMQNTITAFYSSTHGILLLISKAPVNKKLFLGPLWSRAWPLRLVFVAEIWKVWAKHHKKGPILRSKKSNVVLWILKSPLVHFFLVWPFKDLIASSANNKNMESMCGGPRLPSPGRSVL